MVRYLLRWLLLLVCWYCKRWFKFALGWGIVGVCRWVILFLHILHHRTDIYSWHNLNGNIVDACLGLKWYRILLDQPVYSSAFGHFLTRMNYQNMAIAARATLSGGSLPLRSRRDAEQVKHAAIVRAEIDIVSLLVYARTDFHLAKIVGPIPPRRRHGDRRVEMMHLDAKALDVLLGSWPWCLPRKGDCVFTDTGEGSVVAAQQQSTALFVDVFGNFETGFS